MSRRASGGSLALALLVAGQLTLGAPPASAAPARPPAESDTHPAADRWLDAGIPAPEIRTAESSGCGIAVSTTGGILSSCPDVVDIGDFDARLPKALDALRDTTLTSPLTVRSDPPGATVTL